MAAQQMLVSVVDPSTKTTLKSVWLPCPKSPMEMSLVNRNNTNQLYGGDLSVVNSKWMHREATMSWEGTQEELQPVIDMFTGKWGPGPFYVLNPFSLGTNVLPPQWSLPYTAVQRRGGAAVMRLSPPATFPSGGGVHVNPYLVNNAVTGATGLPQWAMRGYFPVDAVTLPDPAFVRTSGYLIPFLIIPVPAGYAGRVMAWGTNDQNTSPLRYILSNTAPTNTSVTTVTPSSSGATSTFASAGSDRHLWIWLNTSSGAGAGVVKLNALGLYLGTSTPGVPTDFQTGQGWNPIVVKGGVDITGYSTPSTGLRKQIGVSFTASEVALPW